MESDLIKLDLVNVREEKTYRCPKCGHVGKNFATIFTFDEKEIARVCFLCMVALIREKVPTLVEVKTDGDR